MPAPSMPSPAPGGAGGCLAAANRVLDQHLAGETQEVNAFSQLQHLYKGDAKGVVTVLSQKVNVVVANADAGAAATRAGAILVAVARFLDGAVAGSNKAAATGKVSCPLLDHVLLLAGAAGEKAPKEKSCRAQCCNLVAALANATPGHVGARNKLLEYAADKVPSIREKAVRGLSALGRSQATDRALARLASDSCTAVRASAVRALYVSPTTAGALLERIDDVEACVRAQLFHRLADQPDAADAFGGAALARLIVGLVDRSAPVRQAAGTAVDAWRERCGGALKLLARCDVLEDEGLGEAVAGALAARYPSEGVAAVKAWLCSEDAAKTDNPAAAAPAVLLARAAVVAMSDEDRDDALDVPALVGRARAVLQASADTPKDHARARWNDFLLRQLLHAMVAVDVGDEQIRREMEQLGEEVLLRAPVLGGGAGAACRRGDRRQPLGAIDLAVVVLRQCAGVLQSPQARSWKRQQQESRFSTRMVLLISDICQPYEGEGAGAGGEGASFAGRLSRQLQQLNAAIDEQVKNRKELEAKKKTAIATEDFMLCHDLKGAFARSDSELLGLRKKTSLLEGERDSVCLRVTAIIAALLRWSSSDLRSDPALSGTLQTILQPMVTLPALSEEVDIAAITAICLFCTRDGATARSHWSLLLQLVRNLRDTAGAQSQRLTRARAAVAARTLADCARLHGESGALDRDEVIGAALSLACVPLHARQVALEPLCGWLLSLGHVFFEEHLLEPVNEVQWALGWMLVEAFRQRGSQAPPKSAEDAKGGNDGAEEAEDGAEDEIDTAMAMHLTQFFGLLPKIPGKQGAPMLSLAVEAVTESGLWRQAVLQPQMVGFHTRFVRAFSWPQLFAFAHERLPVEMRFRLWRCSLQLCVTSPTLAPLAEVPFALANAIAAGQAPPGAAELVREAIALGADTAALAPLAARLPALPAAATAGAGLMPRSEAEAAERTWRASLIEAGVADLEQWAPSSMEVPEVTPPHHRMRGAPRKVGRGARGDDCTSSAATSQPGTPMGTPTPRRPAQPTPQATPQSLCPATPDQMPAAPTPTATPTRTPSAAATPKVTLAAGKGKAKATSEIMPPPRGKPEPKKRRLCAKTAEAGA